jgi:hypothetical protein
MTDRQTESRPSQAPVVDRLAALGRVTFVALMAFGLVSAASRFAEGRAPASTLAVVLDGLRVVFGYSAAGWIAMRMLQEVGGSVARVEARIDSGFDRLVTALESPTSRGESHLDPFAIQVAEIRRAVRDGEWLHAKSLLVTFREAFPDQPEPIALGNELEAAARVAREDLRARIAAAREVNDPERVMELREQIGALLEGEDLRELDQDLAKWFLHLIHRRLRTGSVRPDVAVLAARVAQTLDGTTEGASLRASLPTLRRAAGLCPRCGEPYKGLLDACPACLGTPLAAVPFAPVDGDDELEPIERADEFGIGQLGD